MSRRQPVNVAASVRQRLLDLARQRGQPVQDVLLRHATERLLYRLSASPHRDAFVLKGAVLFAAWTGAPHRASKDVDFLGFGDPAPERLVRIFEELAAPDPRSPDGLVFDPASIRVEAIRAEQAYGGQRVTIAAELAGAIVRVRVDVGFGDVVTPAPVEVVVPTLLDLPPPRLRGYPVETLVAEKLEAMVRFGLANGRLKDYFDVWYVLTRLGPDPRRLTDAIHATFARRGTSLPVGIPLGLSDAFDDSDRRVQWAQFLDRVLASEAERPTLSEVLTVTRPVLMRAVSGG